MEEVPAVFFMQKQVVQDFEGGFLTSRKNRTVLRAVTYSEQISILKVGFSGDFNACKRKFVKIYGFPIMYDIRHDKKIISRN